MTEIISLGASSSGIVLRVGTKTYPRAVGGGIGIGGHPGSSKAFSWSLVGCSG